MSDTLTAHVDNPVEVRSCALAIFNGADRVRRTLGGNSATPDARKAAKKELRTLVRNARALIKEL